MRLPAGAGCAARKGPHVDHPKSERKGLLGVFGMVLRCGRSAENEGVLALRTRGHRRYRRQSEADGMRKSVSHTGRPAEVMWRVLARTRGMGSAPAATASRGSTIPSILVL